MMCFIYVTVIILYPCVWRYIILCSTLIQNCKKGVVIQQSMVRMVCLVLLKNSLKKVFSKLLIAFAKIAEYYLLHLPDDLFEHRLPNAG